MNKEIASLRAERADLRVQLADVWITKEAVDAHCDDLARKIHDLNVRISTATILARTKIELVDPDCQPAPSLAADNPNDRDSEVLEFKTQFSNIKQGRDDVTLPPAA